MSTSGIKDDSRSSSSCGPSSSGVLLSLSPCTTFLSFPGDASWQQRFTWVSLGEHTKCNHGNSIALNCNSKQRPPRAVLSGLVELACKITAISQSSLLNPETDNSDLHYHAFLSECSACHEQWHCCLLHLFKDSKDETPCEHAHGDGEKRNCLAGSLFLTYIHVLCPHTWKQWVVLGQQCSQPKQFKAAVRDWTQEIFEVPCLLVSHKQ